MALHILSVLTLLLFLLTVLPLSRSEVWWVRGLDFPRLQLASLAAALFVLHLIYLVQPRPLGLALLLVTGLSLLYQLWWIVPYTRLHRREVNAATTTDPANAISILTANVLTTNRRADLLLELVREELPDILVTLESDQWWQDQLDTLQADYPHSIKCPLDNLYGMHVYSRLALHDTSTEFLVEDDVPSMHAEVELRSGKTVRVHFLHPAPPSPTENAESAERDAELIMVAKSLEDFSRPTIVTGDLNDVAWSDTTRLFRKISGLLDPRVGRGMFNTFHADYRFIRWPLDHLFHSRHFTVRELKRLRAFGSDHFALYASLSLEPQVAGNHSGLEADREDKDWADEKLAQMDVTESDVPEPER